MLPDTKTIIVAFVLVFCFTVNYVGNSVGYEKMADKQFDASSADKRSVEEYAKRRAALRQEYIKQITNPHRHGTGEGGTLDSLASIAYIASKNQSSVVNKQSQNGGNKV
ncbi:hypothetical protein C0J52_04504 [Blattella germanica]|nr:hypothetical protein C0J52_04504 [Blattella germanica]